MGFRGVHMSSIISNFVLPTSLSIARRKCREERESRRKGCTDGYTGGQISREEALMFSVDEECVVCWDERELRELYTLRNKLKAPISSSSVLWRHNSMVTGHE